MCTGSKQAQEEVEVQDTVWLASSTDKTPGRQGLQDFCYMLFKFSPYTPSLGQHVTVSIHLRFKGLICARQQS